MRWMLDGVARLADVRYVLAVTADGLLQAHSDGIGRDAADKCAAALTGVQSLSRSLAEFCADGPQHPQPTWGQTMVEFDSGYVLIAAVGQGTYLGVSCTAAADLSTVTYEMHQLVSRMGREMTSSPRRDTAPTS
ncbi:roadblock/LC7 domain-containing protein [Streptosporangium sp. NPDC048047]|uniref:roadblock/LC7 domain-containing protein n=1 Tax=Streptosporangium sp. NPDC048047 TaxID=3155748 RepID=UPI0034287DB4